MSQYIYAIIPYNSGNDFKPKDSEVCVYDAIIPELKNVDSELSDNIDQYKDFIVINTCCRVINFVGQENGYCRLRNEIYKIAKALGAKEVWYAEEIPFFELYDDSECDILEKWVERFNSENKKHIVELTTDILQGNCIYSYYHDNFSDIVLEPPTDK